MTTAAMREEVMRRFLQAVKDRQSNKVLHNILGLISKEEFMGWVDGHGLDILHHAIMLDNAEAVDFLLKLGYFARPHQPAVNLYTHLAAHLGHRTVLSVLIQHRPDDFRLSQQPLILPSANCVPPDNCKTCAARARVAAPLAGGKTSSSVSESNEAGASDHERSRAGSTKQASTSTSTSTSTWLSLSRLKVATDAVGVVGHHVQTGAKKHDSSLDDRATADDSGLQTPPLMKTPVDVAALSQHVECVKLLLDVCVLKVNPHAPSHGYLTLSALANSSAAMALMMKESPRRQDHKQEKLRDEDLKAAVGVCLHKVLPECLDIILASENTRILQLFNNISLLHILYTSSASHTHATYRRIPEVTKVLIKWNHDVKATIPPRTYPLYTLISHAFCSHDYSNTSHYLSALRMLLQAGADPNFDEVAFEKRLLQQKGMKAAVGRNAYSTSLHCLLETVETYATYLQSRALAVRFVEECAELLTQFNADITKVGRIGDASSVLHGNVLQQYAKCCVSLGVDRPIMRCLLRHGAEPEVKVKGKYALNVYFDKLFDSLKMCEVVDTNHRLLGDVRAMVDFMCDYMAPVHIQDAATTFMQAHGRDRSPQVQNSRASQITINKSFMLFHFSSASSDARTSHSFIDYQLTNGYTGPRVKVVRLTLCCRCCWSSGLCSCPRWSPLHIVDTVSGCR
ncbi:uncharacterized protein LOC112563219 isoform X2 [Pomacea canaliculata]|nr:uncharacterized protein LOC112563219 isoform X2 [Pomacea canaliculata]XP_025092823.1 uncharacterized protein LOC112563219 isoform X2 [Pomacea canaliculata]